MSLDYPFKRVRLPVITQEACIDCLSNDLGDCLRYAMPLDEAARQCPKCRDMEGVY